MSVKSAANDVLSALNVLERARDVSTKLPNLSEPMTDAELQLRAELTARVIEAHTKLRQIKALTQDLQQALERFKAAQEAMRA
jgi:flagellar hook-associated protein FlgK